jgi:hypothetical protein
MSTLILDLDSSVSETYGDQEGSAYNGHFGCECYNPPFCFNQFGDVDLRRRVVAKVEWHRGELFPRVEFIVTNLRRSARRVVAFDNGRGTAEQWIKEGKNAVRWTRLSCCRFDDN